jgi:hypothetical protein
MFTSRNEATNFFAELHTESWPEASESQSDETSPAQPAGELTTSDVSLATASS